MAYDKTIHNRQSIRMQGFDYSQEGSYFITICTYEKNQLFGEIISDEMKLNQIGVIVRANWISLPSRYKGIKIDEFVIMPNHFHGILTIVEPVIGQTLGNMVGAFKSLVANQHLNLCKTQNMIYEKLWQRNYYEHVIRDEDDYARIANYIENNPLNWNTDQYR